MIRHVIRYIASPLLGLFVRPILAAAHEESSRADAAELNEARALGQRDEARGNARKITLDLDGALVELRRADENIERMRGEIVTLRSELDCAAADDEQHTQTAAALHSVTTERDQLRCRCDALTARASKAEGEAMGLQRDLADSAVRVRQLEEQAAARSEVAPVETERCAWCCGARPDPHSNHSNGPRICTECMNDDSFTWAHVSMRVATRATSCSSRQVADPLAIDCPTCLARSGTVCNGSPSDMTTY